MIGIQITHRIVRMMAALWVGMAASLCFTPTVSALEVDLTEMYLEASTGNVQYHTPDDFLFSGDSYDNPQGLQFLLGVPFKRTDENIVSIEIFYSYLGEAEDEKLANNIFSQASLESWVIGSGLRLGKKVGDHAFLSTRFGAHYWTSDFSVKSVSNLTGASLLKIGAC